jgi:replicative DNA helicase
MSVHPNSTVSVPDIRTTLIDWSREGWVADTVVVDYADILRMDYSGLEKRDQINQTWMELRQLSQRFHCLVVTATQTNAASYDAYTIGKKHFSENKLKRAHTTGNVGLNQTETEKRRGLMRLNWIQVREAEYLESKCVYVAGCPAIANLCMRSSF